MVTSPLSTGAAPTRFDRWLTVALAIAGTTCGLAGCGTSVERPDPQVTAALRAEILLPEEPLGAMTVLDVREMFTGPVDDDHHTGIDHDTHPAENETNDSVVVIDDDHAVATDPLAEKDVPAPEGTADESLLADATAAGTDASPTQLAGPQEVVVVGMIGGMPNPWKETEPGFPFKSGQATIFLVDPATVAEFEDHGHADGSDHHDCPFCARRATQNVDSVAVANIVDQQGTVVSIDARELLDVTENDVVVMRGTADLLGGNLLVINARNVYIRR